MPTLINPQNTVAILQKYEIRAQKKYGQNFLIDPQVPEKILRAAEVGKDDFVLEIGPGIGTLTQYLAERARAVAAVEIDRRLIPVLEETLAPYENVTVICGDILKVDLAALAGEHNGGRPIKVVANLPYYITTPILMELLKKELPIESITVMVQKEVAERMQAGPGTKAYGALSLAVQYYAEAHIAAQVPPNCFLPRPGVGSAVICLKRYEEPPVPCRDPELMFRLIRASFLQRRKTLFNSLGNSAELPFTREQAASAIESLGWPPAVRGEALTLAQFAQLADRLTEEA